MIFGKAKSDRTKGNYILKNKGCGLIISEKSLKYNNIIGIRIMPIWLFFKYLQNDFYNYLVAFWS